MLTDAGRNLIVSMLTGASTDKITKGGFGVDNTTYATDTFVQGSVIVADSCDATTGWTIAGDALAVSTDTTNFKEGTASISTGATYSTGLAQFSKTVTSMNLSASDCKFYAFLYIADVTALTSATDAVSIDLGTGGWTNYNHYHFDRSTLGNGWNYLVFNVATASTMTGAGLTTSTCDSIRLNVRDGTTIAGGNLKFDYFRAVTDGGLGISDSLITLASSNFTTMDKAVRISYSALASQSNGYDISSCDLSTQNGIMFTKSQFSAITKTDNVEVQADELVTVK